MVTAAATANVSVTYGFREHLTMLQSGFSNFLHYLTYPSHNLHESGTIIISFTDGETEAQQV